MISFVTWKWHNPNSSRRKFRSKHVNVLYAMIRRHYPRPYRAICITDDAEGLDPGIEALPMPVRFDNIKSPHGERFPSCYCRLWSFSREATILGERILSLDIDVVILGDLRPLVDREEDFVGWCDQRFGWGKIAGGVYLLRTGTHPYIWEDFDPLVSPAQAAAAGNRGSDQGWMSFKMYPPPGKWDNGAGLTKINWTPHSRQAPQGVRMVFTSGAKPPWSKEAKHSYPWVKEHWRL
jgi:hypothetical protein